MEKREMAGDYEILQAVRLGGKEVLLGYNPKDGCAPYMTSYREVNFLGDYTYVEAWDYFLNGVFQYTRYK